MGLKLVGIMAMLMAAMAASFYWYYNDSQKRMAILIENNSKLEIAVQTNEDAISSMKKDFESQAAELNRINGEFAASRAQNRELQNRLEKHDIGVLAEKKPGLVEKTINSASDKALRCFELLSGAELTESERGATSAKSFNSECPWLWTGSSN
jgi:hypothetical protein